MTIRSLSKGKLPGVAGIVDLGTDRGTPLSNQAVLIYMKDAELTVASFELELVLG